jgi:RNA polymerase sigma factor (sigma-70 family)
VPCFRDPPVLAERLFSANRDSQLLKQSVKEVGSVRMKPNESLPGGEAGRFRTTHWSVVLLSAQTQVPGSRTALADLCRLYWYPLYAFVRRRGYSAEDAQDLTQSFFLSLLERKSLRQVSPEKGKFRSFLLASLKNHLSDAFDREQSIKRGGQIEFVALDFESGEERYREDAVDQLSAEKIFDARWAMTLLDHAMQRLRSEHAVQGRTNAIEALQPFLDPANCKRLPTYEEVAEKLQVSLAGVKTLIHRLRKRYSEILREEVARTVTDPRAVDEEIHALCEALIASEGRITTHLRRDDCTPPA